MIAQLRGVLLHIGERDCLIEVGGVGYQCQMGQKCLTRIGQVGDEAVIYTHTAIKDDGIILTGFADLEMKAAWHLLKTVQGVGDKAALAILSVVAPDALMLAIAAADKAVIQRAEGVGAKLAQRIINELADKVADISLATPASTDAAAPDSARATKTSDPVLLDTISALVNLGYGRSEAHQAVAQLMREQDAPEKNVFSVETLVPLALKQLAKGGRA